MTGIQYDQSRRDQQENLPHSLRRTAVGLTGLQKRLISDLRKFLRRYESPLFDSLAANITTLLPVADVQSQTSCPSITGEVTSPPTVGANQNCTIQSSGSIAVDTAETNNTAVNLSAGPALVKRGTINAELGYGLYSERLLGLVTLKLGWREDAAGERRVRIGATYRANSWLTHQLGVEFGIHRCRTHGGVADFGGDLSAMMSW